MAMSPRGGRRKGAGRKPKPSSQRRGKSVTVALTEEQALRIQELAGDETASAYVHRLIERHLKRVKR